MLLELLMSVSIVYGSSFSDTNLRYLFATLNSSPSFDNFSGQIDIYYSFTASPQEWPYIQILDDNELLVQHQFSVNDFYRGKTPELTSERVFKYSYPIETFQHTNTYYFYLTFNDDDLAYFGNSYSFEIVFAYDDYATNSYYEGYNNGFNAGRIEGFNEGVNSVENNEIGNMLLSIADIPFRIFNDFLGFEIFGFNLVGFITGLLGIVLVGWIIKKVI